MKNNWLLTIILVVVVGVSAFYGGTKYQQSKRGNFAQFSQNGGSTGRGGMMGGRLGGIRPVAGEIISADDKSITVKLQDGSSRIVILSGSTAINKQASGSKTDLKTGEKVAVFGQENSDGSVTAQSIQLNPQIRVRPTQ